MERVASSRRVPPKMKNEEIETRPKYQVFISSTYTDLFEEREQVIKATLELEHIPVGMEMFSAADERQWKIITRQIDQSDYYAVIVAHRYDSVQKGISFTEKEYDYAICKAIPVIGFVIDDKAPWPSDKMEDDSNKRDSLRKFKDKMKLKPVAFWQSADDLHGKYVTSLTKLIEDRPRPGWVRGMQVRSRPLPELVQLMEENTGLKRQVDNFAQLRKEKRDLQGQVVNLAQLTKQKRDMQQQVVKFAQLVEENEKLMKLLPELEETNKWLSAVHKVSYTTHGSREYYSASFDVTLKELFEAALSAWQGSSQNTPSGSQVEEVVLSYLTGRALSYSYLPYGLNKDGVGFGSIEAKFQKCGLICFRKADWELTVADRLFMFMWQLRRQLRVFQDLLLVDNQTSRGTA